MQKVSIKKLMELSGVNLRTIQRRIKDGFIKIEKPDGYHTLINLEQFDGKDLKSIFLRRCRNGETELQTNDVIKKINGFEQEKIFINAWLKSNDCIVKKDEITPIKDAYNDFINKYDVDIDFFSKQKLIALIKEYCDLNDIIFRSGRKSNYRFFKIKDKYKESENIQTGLISFD